MLTYMCTVGVILSCASSGQVLAQPSQYPSNITTCEEFEYGARFSPFAVIDAMWKIFYFWSNMTEVYPIIFSLAAKNRIQKFREVYDSTTADEKVDWDKAMLVMEPRPGIEVMLVYQGTPGAFRAIVKKEQRDKVRPYREPLIRFTNVRMKLVNRFMGMLCCEDLTAYALVRVDEMPGTEELCQKAAATIGYHGYEGRSYLYLKQLEKQDEL